ncbi:hypothetical protein Pcinc_011653 [Petrolisthes cinctipes]|uniref:Uncharacterized protein n=1 Tax=Petrolisthes cinctipes TaxID=88211 RepID=A0AAE1G2D1_PETCI|nr:hypothetical protein Pcinc_011653 [Petrolisthes cinctipes]
MPDAALSHCCRVTQCPSSQLSFATPSSRSPPNTYLPFHQPFPRRYTSLDRMGRPVLPFVLLLVAVIVKLIISAPIAHPEHEDVNNLQVHDSFSDGMVKPSIFRALAKRPCVGHCHRRDPLGRCRVNFSCLMSSNA